MSSLTGERGVKRVYPSPLSQARPRPYPGLVQISSPLNPNFEHHRSPIRLVSSTPTSPIGYCPYDNTHRHHHYPTYPSSPDSPPHTRIHSASPRAPLISSDLALDKKGRQLPPKAKLLKVVHVYSAGDDAVALRIKRDRERRRKSSTDVQRSRPGVEIKIANSSMLSADVPTYDEAVDMEVILDDKWEGSGQIDGVHVDRSVYARRKEAKKHRLGKEGQRDTPLDANGVDAVGALGLSKPDGIPRRPSLPGINSVFNVAGIDAGLSHRPSLTSAASFPDLGNLAGPLSSGLPSSGSSFSYTLSPTSSGRLSRFSSFGFDPRSSLGSLESPRSSVSGPPPHGSFPWWNREGARSHRDEGPASAEGSGPDRKPSFARFAFDTTQRSPVLEVDRRASEKGSHTSATMDRDEDALQRYSRFQSYPSGVASAAYSQVRAPIGSHDSERRDSGVVLAPAPGLDSRTSYRRDLRHGPDSIVSPQASHPILNRNITAPSPLHPPTVTTSSRPQTPTEASPLLSLANAAALANEREREQRRASQQGAGMSGLLPRDRLSSGPVFGPFTDNPKSRIGSLQGISLWGDDDRLGVSGLADLELDHAHVRRTGSLTDSDERQGRSIGLNGRGGSLNASPSRPPRHDKPYPSRGERAYRPRMTSIAVAGTPSRDLNVAPTLGDHPPASSSRPRDRGIRNDYRRDSAIPPEGFAPVNRGHDEHLLQLVKVEDPDYPSVLRRDPSVIATGRSSVQVTPTGSAVSTPMMQATAPTIMVPPGYTLTPVYAHPAMGSGNQAGFSPYYSGSQARPLMMVPMGSMGQAGPAIPYSGGPMVAQTSVAGPSSSNHADGRRESSGRDNQQGPRYTCEVCHKQFNRPSSLKIHMYSHTGEKPYRCTWPNCRRSFSVQSNLKRHAKVHLDNEAAADAQAEAFGNPAQAELARNESTGHRPGHSLHGGGQEFDEEEEDELEEDEDDVDMEDDGEPVIGRVGNVSAIRIKREE